MGTVRCENYCCVAYGISDTNGLLKPAASAQAHAVRTSPTSRAAPDLASLVTTAVLAAMRLMQEQFSSLQTRMHSLANEIEVLKMQDGDSGEEDEPMAAVPSTPRGVDKRKDCERAGPSTEKQTHGV